MSATKANTGKNAKGNTATARQKDSVDLSAEVLNMSEAARFLRVGQEELLRLVYLQELPGRQIGNEWRFLKSALQDWLRTPGRKTGKEAMLALAGAWKDDPDIGQIVQQAHQRRGRPATEHDE